MSKYFKGDVYCIYLDQDASSCLTHPQNDLWRDIRDLVLLLHGRNRIICPLSLEHVMETSRRDLQKATEQDKLLRALSNGYAFKREVEIAASQLVAKVEEREFEKTDFLGLDIIRSLEDVEVRSEAKQLVDHYKQITDESQAGTNHLKKELRGQRLPPLAEQIEVLEVILNIRLVQHGESP